LPPSDASVHRPLTAADAVAAFRRNDGIDRLKEEAKRAEEAAEAYQAVHAQCVARLRRAEEGAARARALLDAAAAASLAHAEADRAAAMSIASFLALVHTTTASTAGASPPSG
jgi:hypothetical protein